MATLIKKISTKTVCGDLRGMVRKGEIKTDTRVMRVLGHVKGLKTGTGDNGDWVKLLGTFEATNLLTGETFHAGSAFVPDVCGDLIISQLQAVQNDDPNAAIQFGVDIGIRMDESSVTGYVYDAEFLVKQEADPLAALREQVPPLQLEHKADTDASADSEKGGKKGGSKTKKEEAKA